MSTFVEAHDFDGKTVIPFCTSGGSGIGRTAEKLRPYAVGAEIVEAKVVRSAADMKSWADGV